MHAGLVIETPYCTQQTGVLTQGMTLRAIQTAEAAVELRKGTIERVLGMSDLELGLQYLPGRQSSGRS
jgi:hypothetical protein